MIAQGDIWDGVDFYVPLPGGRREVAGRVMVISHNCEAEKGLLRVPTWPFSIAPMIEIDSFPRGEPKAIRARKFLRYWGLPEVDPLAEGWAVDLDLVQPTLAATVQDGTRVASIDDDGRKVLVMKLVNVLSLREIVNP
jgi:hypothetical protein